MLKMKFTEYPNLIHMFDYHWLVQYIEFLQPRKKNGVRQKKTKILNTLEHNNRSNNPLRVITA